MGNDVAGRVCPADYAYGPRPFSGAQIETRTLYVVGGLYGNAFALDAVLARAEREATRPAIVFNGDFHWFDCDADVFARVHHAVLREIALQGNVECEIARPAAVTAVGCGCAYPDTTAAAEVERSNRIFEHLARTARSLADVADTCRALPRAAVAHVGEVRIGIVHGDVDTLAGWRYAQDRLHETDARARLQQDFAAHDVRVLASSHTCLPVALTIAAQHGRCALINNGAAGMPNFKSTRFGVFTRISTTPAPDALYRATVDGVSVEALPLRYDHETFVAQFDRQWPAGSDAALSYRERIVFGPQYHLHQAARTGFAVVTDQDRRAPHTSQPLASDRTANVK